jgi:hypothetical protein
MITSTDQARQLFSEKVKDYKNVTEGDILALVMIINKKLKEHNKKGEASICSLNLSKRLKMKRKSNGSIENCYLRVNSHYFTGREAISFNNDGFIGFCGELDQSNTQPFLDAFEEWCLNNFNIMC